MTALRSVAVLAAVAVLGLGAQDRGRARLRALPFDAVEVTDAFWSERIDIDRRVTLRACLDQCEKTGRIHNLMVAGGLAKGRFEGRRYNDSDVYKVLEGIAYVLASGEDPELEARADRIIGYIAAAQQADGYVNSYYSLVKPGHRFEDIAHGHELYSAGHLIEAGIAYARATGKRKLVEVAVRFADLIGREFGPGKRLDPPGHQELELALLALADFTGNPRYAELAKFFLERRGDPRRGKLYGDYAQDQVPVREQREAVGHAVRAMYQYSAMTDLVARTGDPGMRSALESIWRGLRAGKLYVTGGIGANASNEGFTRPYWLPNDGAYAETCAAVGLALWTHRMFLLTGETGYGDVLDAVLYNGLLSGVSLAGDRFFYTNPLASRGGDARRPWFTTACCPTNIARYVPAIGGRVWAHDRTAIVLLLFVASRTHVALDGGAVGVRLESGYPWRAVLDVHVDPEQSFVFELRVRVPDWCRSPPSVRIGSGPSRRVEPQGGFLRLRRRWKKGDTVRIDLPMPPRRVHADPRVAADRGRVAIRRGPVVYCLEAADHGGHARNLVLPADAELRLVPGDGGRVAIEARGLAVVEQDGGRRTEPVTLHAIPYYAWNNRGPGEMVVWIPETAALAELPGEAPFEVADGVKVRASWCWSSDTVLALLDGELPESSDDQSLPRMTWWSRKGTREWVSYEFPKTRRLTWSDVYWFDDGPRGGCRRPKAWRLLWRDGKAWKPVVLRAGSRYGVEKDRFNRVDFAAVETTGIRIEADLRAGLSGGILEWRTGGAEKTEEKREEKRRDERRDL